MRNLHGIAAPITQVGKVAVPIKRAKFVSYARFTRGADGVKSAGDYCFWTAVMKKGRKTWGRAHIALGAGDRFDRMEREMRQARSEEARVIYGYTWIVGMKRGENIAYIRPSTLKEIRKWCDSHKKDARWMVALNVNGKRIK